MTTTIEVKTPPNSKESEMMVLGCMLTNTYALNVAADLLQDSDFFYDQHKLVFGVLKSAKQSDSAVDTHLVAEELKRNGKLKAVGGIDYLTTLAQYAGTSANIEEYSAIIKRKSTLRRLIDQAQLIERRALDDPDDHLPLLDEAAHSFKLIANSSRSTVPIISTKDRVEAIKEKWDLYRGKEHIGLCMDTLPIFNERMLGLREMILLAAAPNVGKTALIVQMVVDVIKRHPESCAVIVSLEMSAESLINRIICHLAGIPFKTLILGSQGQDRSDDPNAYFTKGELASIDTACRTLGEFGNRLQIIEGETVSNLHSRDVIHLVEQVKERTGCTRAFVAVDYLQVWPLVKSSASMNELEADKWRIGEIKKIRDALKGDPVIVISESRKPGAVKEQWGGDMSDVMGSARGVYSPDCVLLLQEVSEDTLAKIFAPKGNEVSETHKKAAKETIEKLQKENACLRYLKMPKGRDGMERFNILLRFDWKQNVFSEFRRIN